MKVLIDHQIFEAQKFGGISRYFFELMKEFSLSDQIQVDLSLQYSNNEYIKDLKNIMPITSQNSSYPNFMFGKEFRGKAFLYNLYQKTQKAPKSAIEINKENSIKKLKKGDFDVFHATYYDDYFLEHLNEKPYVITVYDLIHQIYPEYFPLNSVDKSRKILDQASKIIAISHSTKKDLIDFYDLPEDKIKVTYLASSLENHVEDDNHVEGLPENFILFVGNRTIYKNFYFFAEVLSKIIKNYPNLNLVCTGSAFTLDEKLFLQKIGLLDKTSYYYVNDSQLKTLYQKALFFIFPSTYEGFGIPILEAFDNGCPVLLAKNSSLQEIGSDAAYYFESKSAKSLKTSLQQMIENANLRKSLIMQGNRRLRDFSWKTTAQQTIKIYNEIHGQKL